MARALAVDKHGKLKISEADIVKAVCDLLALRGWMAIQTPAEAFLPSGRRVVNAGFSDYVFVRPNTYGAAHVIFAEFKRPNAATSAPRKAKQEKNQQELEQRGYLAYRCPDGCPSPVQHFLDWYEQEFSK